jgi:hypothetical protein
MINENRRDVGRTSKCKNSRTGRESVIDGNKRVLRPRVDAKDEEKMRTRQGTTEMLKYILS